MQIPGPCVRPGRSEPYQAAHDLLRLTRDFTGVREPLNSANCRWWECLEDDTVFQATDPGHAQSLGGKNDDWRARARATTGERKVVGVRHVASCSIDCFRNSS